MHVYVPRIDYTNSPERTTHIAIAICVGMNGTCTLIIFTHVYSVELYI